METSRCVVCLRQIIRRPYMQAQMEKLAELDPEVADMARKRFELGWSNQRVADAYVTTERIIRNKMRYAILYLRRACNGQT